MTTPLRLFLGIPLPHPLAFQLQDWQAEQPKVAGLKWVEPPLWHITLYFLGNVPTERLDNLINLIRLVMDKTPPFELAFEAITLGPKPKEPRMIWARYQKADRFKALVQQIHQLYSQIEPDTQMRKSPIPHITLARFKQPEIAAHLSLSPVALPPLPVEEAILWASELTPAGPIYRPKARFWLGGKG